MLRVAQLKGLATKIGAPVQNGQRPCRLRGGGGGWFRCRGGGGGWSWFPGGDAGGWFRCRGGGGGGWFPDGDGTDGRFRARPIRTVDFPPAQHVLVFRLGHLATLGGHQPPLVCLGVARPDRVAAGLVGNDDVARHPYPLSRARIVFRYRLDVGARIDYLQASPAALLAVPYRRLGAVLARQPDDHLVDRVAALRAVVQQVKAELVRPAPRDQYRVPPAVDLHIADLEPESRPAPVRLNHCCTR
jgi:hypothetical protein